MPDNLTKEQKKEAYQKKIKDGLENFKKEIEEIGKNNSRKIKILNSQEKLINIFDNKIRGAYEYKRTGHSHAYLRHMRNVMIKMDKTIAKYNRLEKGWKTHESGLSIELKKLVDTLDDYHAKILNKNTTIDNLSTQTMNAQTTLDRFFEQPLLKVQSTNQKPNTPKPPNTQT